MYVELRSTIVSMRGPPCYVNVSFRSTSSYLKLESSIEKHEDQSDDISGWANHEIYVYNSVLSLRLCPLTSADAGGGGFFLKR